MLGTTLGMMELGEELKEPACQIYQRKGLFFFFKGYLVFFIVSSGRKLKLCIFERLRG